MSRLTGTTVLVGLMLGAGACGAGNGPLALELQDAVRVEPQTVLRGEPAEVGLPALPAKAGKAVVLRFRAVIVSKGRAGCNYNASVWLNGAALGRRMVGGEERLIAREPVLELAAGRYPPFAVFSGGKLMMMFAPDADTGDGMTRDGLGATFALDITDAARGVDGNTLTFRNENPADAKDGLGLLKVTDIEVGWLDRASIPAPPSLVPERGPVAAHVTVGEVRLSQSTRGGFAVRAGDGPELLVETGIGMKPEAVSVLLADDAAPAAEGLEVTTDAWGSAGFRMTASWAGLALQRTVRIVGGLVEWKERWTNTGEATRGVPFRHRLFVRGESARFWVGGSADNVSLATTACNPTLFLEAPKQPGNGWGMTAESDWLRLLMELRGVGGVGEVFSDTLALAPGSSIDFEMTLEGTGGSQESGARSQENGKGNGIAAEAAPTTTTGGMASELALRPTTADGIAAEAAPTTTTGGMASELALRPTTADGIAAEAAPTTAGTASELALRPTTADGIAAEAAPTTGGGGYWSFINGVRERWGVNGVTQERPVFWGYAHTAEGATPEEKVARELGNLGPITVVLGPWQRLQPDAYVVRAGNYPKLPEGAPRAPGACPDLDVEAFLTFEHREAYWTELQQQVELIRKAAPNVKIMQMLHPAMEAVYRPLQDRWPEAAEAILTPEGKVFESAHYSRSWLGDYADKDWGVLYYVPRPGSAYLEMIMEGVTRALDELNLDGIYCDEFSWAFSRSGYSRYDYSRWDGYSADLDEEGNVVRLKADGAAVTESCQLRMTGEVLRRGRYFLGNGGSALRSLNSLPIARFIEGGNGASRWSQGHLSATPLVLGNMGDEKTREGVFASVKACLHEGCLYSPTAVNLLLDGPSNFVSKLYPMTVREIGPGWIVGEERIATTVSRRFPWPGGEVRRYAYDAKGDLLDAAQVVETLPAGEIALQVPEGGLVIAEGSAK